MLCSYIMNQNDHSDDEHPNQEPPPDGEGQDMPFVQQLHQSSVGARLTDDVAAGVFATGAMVLRGPEEFLIDFVQAMRHPPRVVARVVMSHRVMGQFVKAIKNNLAKYQQSFGPPKSAPKMSREQPSIEKIYEDLKLPDELLCGAYANVIMVGHSHGEFLLDFVTQFFPKAAVSARVYVSASNMPGLLKTLSTAHTHTPPKTPPNPSDDQMYS